MTGATPQRVSRWLGAVCGGGLAALVLLGIGVSAGAASPEPGVAALEPARLGLPSVSPTVSPTGPTLSLALICADAPLAHEPPPLVRGPLHGGEGLAPLPEAARARLMEGGEGTAAWTAMWVGWAGLVAGTTLLVSGVATAEEPGQTGEVLGGTGIGMIVAGGVTGIVSLVV